MRRLCFRVSSEQRPSGDRFRRAIFRMEEKSNYPTFPIRWDFEQELCVPDRFRGPLSIGWYLKEIAAKERPILRLAEYARISAPPSDKKSPRIYSWFILEDEEDQSLVIHTVSSRISLPLEGLALAMMNRAIRAHEVNGGKEADLKVRESAAPIRMNGHPVSLWMVVHPLNGESAAILPSWEAVRCMKSVEAGADFPYTP